MRLSSPNFSRIRDLATASWERGCPNYATGAAVLLLRVSSRFGMRRAHQACLVCLAADIFSSIHHHFGEAKCLLTLTEFINDPLEAIEFTRIGADVLEMIAPDAREDHRSKVEPLRNSIVARKSHLVSTSAEEQDITGDRHLSDAMDEITVSGRDEAVNNMMALASGQIPAPDTCVEQWGSTSARQLLQQEILQRITAKYQLFQKVRNFAYCASNI